MDYGMRQTDKKGTHGSWPTLCPRLFAPSGLFLGPSAAALTKEKMVMQQENGRKRSVTAVCLSAVLTGEKSMNMELRRGIEREDVMRDGRGEDGMRERWTKAKME